MLITKSSLCAAGSGHIQFPWSICLFLMPLHVYNYCNLFKTLISSRTRNFAVPYKFWVNLSSISDFCWDLHRKSNWTIHQFERKLQFFWIFLLKNIVFLTIYLGHLKHLLVNVQNILHKKNIHFSLNLFVVPVIISTKHFKIFLYFVIKHFLSIIYSNCLWLYGKNSWLCILVVVSNNFAKFLLIPENFQVAFWGFYIDNHIYKWL